MNPETIPDILIDSGNVDVLTENNQNLIQISGPTQPIWVCPCIDSHLFTNIQPSLTELFLVLFVRGIAPALFKQRQSILSGSMRYEDWYSSLLLILSLLSSFIISVRTSTSSSASHFNSIVSTYSIYFWRCKLSQFDHYSRHFASASPLTRITDN